MNRQTLFYMEKSLVSPTTHPGVKVAAGETGLLYKGAALLDKLRGYGNAPKLPRRGSLWDIEVEIKPSRTVRRVRARVFDWDTPIAAPYSAGTNYQQVTAALSSKVWESAIHEPEMAYEVESFDSLPEKSMEPAIEPPSPNLDVGAPIAGEMKTAGATGASEPHSLVPSAGAMDADETSTDQAVVRGDLEAILKSSRPQPAIAPADTNEAVKLPVAGGRHDIFDAMAGGFNLENATTFDMGNVAVNMQAIEAAIDAQEAREAMGAKSETEAASNPSQDLSPEEILNDIKEIQAKPPQKTKPIEAGEPKPVQIDEPETKSGSPQDAQAPTEPLKEKPQAAPLKEEKGVSEKISDAPQYDISYQVPLIPQKEGLSAWSACGAMLVAEDKKAEFNIQDLFEGKDFWADYNSKLTMEADEAVKAWGLKSENRTLDSVEELAGLLRDKGPLVFSPTISDPHPRVISDITGDGSKNKTQLTIVDPLERHMTSYAAPNKGEVYKLSFSEFTALLADQESDLKAPGTILIAYLEKHSI